ncbi:hypothetical protein BZA05DRAFT_409444 [Tricharina praecox]|uniref:uncharacterized protein n=1 Tax=Tricharina praecox TaxID=43433 RepID=UPI00221F27C5|nr:uncharacterized protein BZA05DRAFT_409444 [Tricharina praecox]KAI5844221.1 hypothetical protein BZA05DRAFT_409444 [Tricharina praecox]
MSSPSPSTSKSAIPSAGSASASASGNTGPEPAHSEVQQQQIPSPSPAPASHSPSLTTLLPPAPAPQSGATTSTRATTSTSPTRTPPTATPNPTATEKTPKQASAAAGAGAGAADDLLAPQADYDWSGFLGSSAHELSAVESDEKALLEEYRSWEWLHELYTIRRAQSESVRFSREYVPACLPACFPFPFPFPFPPVCLSSLCACFSSVCSGVGSDGKTNRIATVARWTQLKEAEVEEARVSHTQDMERISSVLGISSPSPAK